MRGLGPPDHLARLDNHPSAMLRHAEVGGVEDPPLYDGEACAQGLDDLNVEVGARASVGANAAPRALAPVVR